MGKSKNINHVWTLSEESFLIENYHKMPWNFLLEKLHRHSKSQIIDKASYMGLKRERLFSFDDIEKLKNIYEQYDSVDVVVDYFNGKYTKKQIVKKANKLGLKNRKYASKTLKNIDEYIRSNNNEWKIQSLINCGHCCVFTGNKDIDIHHIYPFHKILYEVFEEFGYDIGKEYSLSHIETELICNEFYKKQKEYGYGVCIDKNIHQIFHSKYGYKNFTSDNWFEFKQDLLNGLYNEMLYEKGINLLSKKCG